MVNVFEVNGICNTPNNFKLVSYLKKNNCLMLTLYVFKQFFPKSAESSYAIMISYYLFT